MKARVISSVVVAVGCALMIQCSMLVSSSLENVRCSQSGQVGPPACEAGWFCGRGRCRQCQASEACGDQLDNDCNGRVDDGCKGDAGSLAEAGQSGG